MLFVNRNYNINTRLGNIVGSSKICKCYDICQGHFKKPLESYKKIKYKKTEYFSRAVQFSAIFDA